MPITIKRSERVFIVGQTGSGKSYLAARLLMPTNYVIVIDSKHMFTWGHGGKFDDVYETVADLDQYWDGPAAAIYRPSMAECAAGCQAFFSWAWEQGGNILIYIDEILDLMDGTGKAARWLTKIMTQGRAKNLSVWGGTQRPSRVDFRLMSEAQHFFVGLLTVPEDQKRVADMSGAVQLRDLLKTGPPEYHFYHVTPKDRGKPPDLITANAL